MAIKPGYKSNYESIIEAAKNDDLGLVECKDKKTGKTVIVLIAGYWDKEEMFNMVPLAKMFDGCPYEELLPPGVDDEEGGGHA